MSKNMDINLIWDKKNIFNRFFKYFLKILSKSFLKSFKNIPKILL